MTIVGGTMLDFSNKFRQHLRLLWEVSALDQEGLSKEDQLLVEIMQLHPQYYELWERLDEVSDEELQKDGTNPVLHVLIHQIIENQIAGQSPPETAETLEQLQQQGFNRHEAVHKIGEVLARDMAEMMQSQQSFDNQRYVQSLRQLVRPRRRRRRRR